MALEQNTNIVFSTTSSLSIFEKRLSVNTENKNYPTLVMNQLIKGPITLILNLPRHYIGYKPYFIMIVFTLLK